MKPKFITAELWLDTEDRGGRKLRIERLKWLESLTPITSWQVFPGGWMARALFEEARYCFAYGQFVASIALAFAYIERTLAGMLYAAGDDTARRANISQLVDSAVAKGWLTDEERDEIDVARGARNPMLHYRELVAEDSVENRVLNGQQAPYDLIESDARHVLRIAFSLLTRNSA